MYGRAAFSVDLETFQQTPAYRSARGTTPRCDIGLEWVDFLLDRLDKYNATATFFTVASIAENHPDLVVEIVDRGHEIASHGRTHVHLSELSRERRRYELQSSQRILERVTGARVRGFRAPSFDIAEDHFEQLAAIGYEYDSSTVPSRSIPGWYGGGPQLHRPVPATDIRADPPNRLVEVPVSVMPYLRLPLTGTWLRFFGSTYTVTGMRLLARRGIQPVLYVHPWELADLPDVSGVPRRVYVRTGAWMRCAVDRILQQPFKFVSTGSLTTEVET